MFVALSTAAETEAVPGRLNSVVRDPIELALDHREIEDRG